MYDPTIKWDKNWKNKKVKETEQIFVKQRVRLAQSKSV